jgi:MATE family multidrug resistance protein
LIVFRVQIAQAFSTDPEVISVGSQVLVMAGIFQLADGMQAVGAGILRGLTDVKIIMLYAFIAYICINIPLGYVLAFVCGFGAVGIWAAFIFGLGTAAILFHVRYHKVRKRIFAELQEQVIL